MGARGIGTGLSALGQIGTTALWAKMLQDPQGAANAAGGASPDNPVVTSGPEVFNFPQTANSVIGSGLVVQSHMAPSSGLDLFTAMRRRPDLFAGKPAAIKDFFNENGVAVSPKDLETLSQQLQDLFDVQQARNRDLERSPLRDSVGTSGGRVR